MNALCKAGGSFAASDDIFEILEGETENLQDIAQNNCSHVCGTTIAKSTTEQEELDAIMLD